MTGVQTCALPIYFFHLVQHSPKVRELPGVGIFFEHGRRVILVHVAQRHDIFAGHRADVVAALSADADAGKIEFPVRGRAAAQPQDRAWQDHKRGGGKRGAAQESAAGDFILGRCGFHIAR